MLTSRYGRPAGRSQEGALLLPSHWTSTGCGIPNNSLQQALLGTTSLEEAMQGQVGSLGKAIGSLAKALGAAPVALQAAPQGAQVEGNLSSLGGGGLRKAGTNQPYVGDKKPRPDFEAPRFGTRGFGSSCRRMEEGGCTGGVKKHLTT